MSSNEEAVLSEHPRRWRRRGWRFPLIFIAIVAVASAVFFFLWNALIPSLFHGPALTYLQALGLLVLSKIIFGGRGMGRRRMAYQQDPWAHLSEEDRQLIREKIRERRQ